MFGRNETIEIYEETSQEPVVMTGKCRAVLNPYNFKYYVEQLHSNGEWVLNEKWPVFNSIADAKAHFERAKKIIKQVPADLGDLNEV